MKILWSGKYKKDAEANLAKWYKPADPDSHIGREGGKYVIYADAKVAMVPTVVRK